MGRVHWEPGEALEGRQARPWKGDRPSGLSLRPPCDLGGEAWYLAPHLPSLPLIPEEPPSTWRRPGGVVGGGLWRAVTGLPGRHTCWHLQHHRRSVCKGGHTKTPSPENRAKECHQPWSQATRLRPPGPWSPELQATGLTTSQLDWEGLALLGLRLQVS